MGYLLNCLDEPVFMAVSKPLLNEFGIHHRLESCVASTGKVVIICFLPKYGYFDALGNVASVKEKKL